MCCLVYDNFIRLREEMSQPYEGSFKPRPIDDKEIFVKNVGGVKKSRLYGIGSEISIYCNLSLLLALHLRQVIAMS